MSTEQTHYTKKVQAKHLSDIAVMKEIERQLGEQSDGYHGCGAILWDVQKAFPQYPAKVVAAKLVQLINRRWLTGCKCGRCRGDYETTELWEHNKIVLVEKGLY